MLKSLFFRLYLITTICNVAYFSNAKAPSSNDTLANESISSDRLLPDFFFDQGSWFGLQTQSGKFGLGAPLLLSDSMGYSFHEPLLTLAMEGFQPAITNEYMLGRITQKSRNWHIDIDFATIFLDKQTALLSYTLTNNTKKQLAFDLDFEIASGADEYNSTLYTYHLSNAELRIKFEQTFERVNETKLRGKISLEPGERKTYSLQIQHVFEGERLQQTYTFKDALDFFKENSSRRTDYLQPYAHLSKEKQLLAEKCIQTMINNWRSSSAELQHAGLFPSYHQGYFNGFWAWDSWKHAVALSTFNPELAKDQIRAMFDFQDEFGMIADAVFRDQRFEQNNWRNTKPPLAAWAVYKVFKQTGDKEFVRELLPQLNNYHEWWYLYRDHNHNGLCEFGSTDGTKIAAAWESGMDNAVRFDEAVVLQNDKNAWSFNQESVDLNAYLYAEKQFLTKLASAVDEELAIIRPSVTELKKKLSTTFYDTTSAYFYDHNFQSGDLVKAIGPEAWIVLWSKAASQEQASAVVEKLMSPDHFNTFCPFPTLSASHPKFKPEEGYWRGPVWLDQAYFALVGMRSYGFEQEADELQEKLFQNASGLLDAEISIRENYHPTSGKGLNAHHFSWSAAHLLLLLSEESKHQ